MHLFDAYLTANRVIICVFIRLEPQGVPCAKWRAFSPAPPTAWRHRQCLRWQNDGTQHGSYLFTFCLNNTSDFIWRNVIMPFGTGYKFKVTFNFISNCGIIWTHLKFWFVCCSNPVFKSNWIISHLFAGRKWICISLKKFCFPFWFMKVM